MSYKSTFHLLLLLGLIAMACDGCSRDPNVRKQKYVESGRRYFDKGKYPEAVIQFRNAIQVDSKYDEAYFQLAKTHLRLQQWNEAYQELSKALELEPRNYPAHLDMATLLIAERQFKQAQEHTDLLHQQQPNNPQVHLAVASLLAVQEKFSEAIKETGKAIELAPDQGDFYLQLAVLQMRTDQLDLAEVSFKKAVALAPKSINAQLALGAYYWSRGRNVEAEQPLLRAMEVDPTNPDPCAALVRLYMVQNKKDQAEAFLKQVQPRFRANPAGYRMLGDFYFAVGDTDKAISEYASLYRDYPQDVQLKKNWVQLLIIKGRLDDARKLDDEMLETSPNNTDALIFRGQMKIREGQADDAANALEAAVKGDPNNAAAHYQLGLAYDLLNKPERAETEWREAVRLTPGMFEAHRSLAAVSIRKADWNGLDQTATTIMEGEPNSPDGYALHAIAATHLGQTARAEKDIHQAIAVAPESPVGYLELGNLRLLSKRYGDAEDAYQKALDIDPSSTNALGGLMQNYLAQRQTDKAIAAARAHIAKIPESSGFYDLLGTALFNDAHDYLGAEAALRKAAELDRKNSDTLLKLGQVQKAEGSADQAILTYQQSIKNNPRAPSLYIMLGEIYEATLDWANARSAYEKVLELQPENAVASNNLAYIIMQHGGNLDVALAMAQTARRGMPDSASTADTLGWAYFMKGLYPAAMDLFKQALNRNPNNPTFHYHLGLAYQKVDQRSLARQHLEQVLKMSPNYPDLGGVKKAISQLHG